MLTTLSRIIFPPRCVLCQQPGVRNLDICQQCYQSLPFIEYACSQCALPFQNASDAGHVCGRCLKQSSRFDKSLSLMRYEGAAVQLVTRYKFHDRLAYSRLLAELFLERLIIYEKPQCLIAVPLHVKRLRERGFNQSHELGKMLRAKLGVPLVSDVVERIRETRQQTGLDAKQRRQNIRGAFAVVAPIECQHVALIDDVVTTGSTVNELARVLKKSGVQTVSVWSIARAVK